MKTGNTLIIYTIYTHLNILRIKHLMITITAIKCKLFPEIYDRKREGETEREKKKKNFEDIKFVLQQF